MVLNFSISDFQILVGNLDVTNAVTGFGAAHDKAEVGEPLIWSGKLNLTSNISPYQLSESLDNLTNPQRWAKGVHPVKVFLWGGLFLTLRILDYTFDEDTGESEATLTDKLGLIAASGSTKDRPLTGFVPGASRSARKPWTEIAVAVATEGSQVRHRQLLQKNDIILPQEPGNATYSIPPPLRSRSTNQMASIASASANSWIWCDKNERILFAKYPNLGTIPAYRLGRKQVEKFKRLPPDPANEVTSVEAIGEVFGSKSNENEEVVPNYLARPIAGSEDIEDIIKDLDEGLESGTYKLIVTSGVSYPIIIESPKNAPLKIQTIFQPVTGFGITIRREDTIARIDTVLPDSDSTGYITSEEKYSEERYSSDQAILLLRKIVKSEPLGKIAPDVFPGETGRVVSEELSERWAYNPDGTPAEKEITILRPVCVIFKSKKFGTGRIVAEKIVETWIKLSGDLTGQKYQHEILVYKTKGELYPDKHPNDATLVLSPEDLRTEIVDSLPSPITQEPRTPLEVKITNKEKEFDFKPNAGDEDLEGSETVFTVELTDVPDSGDSLEEVAQTVGEIFRQRVGAREISHPLNREDLLNYYPFKVCDVHSGRFIRDGFGIALGEGKEIGCFFVGNFMGAILPVPEQPTQIWQSQTSVPVSQSVPITPIRVPVGAVANNLPDGLTLVGTEIVGTPIGTGATTATIVADQTTYSLIFDSSLLPIAIAPYRQITTLEAASSRFQGIWQVAIAPNNAAIEAIAVPTSHQGYWQVDPPIFRIRVEAIAQWSLPSLIYGSIEASHQGEWKVEPLYFRNIVQNRGTWEVEQIAQFIYVLNKNIWYVNPLYAPIAARLQGNWSVMQVLPPSAAGRVFTISQSSVRNGDSQFQGTYLKLTDGDLTTGAATSGYLEWISVDFGQLVTVASITVGAGTVGNLAASQIAYSLNRCVIQYSNNNFDWQLAVTITGVTANNSRTFAVANIVARFWRIANIEHEDFTIAVSTSEFRFT